MVGLGQREGLHIRSVYRVREKQEEAFMKSSGWKPHRLRWGGKPVRRRRKLRLSYDSF